VVLGEELGVVYPDHVSGAVQGDRTGLEQVLDDPPERPVHHPARQRLPERTARVIARVLVNEVLDHPDRVELRRPDSLPAGSHAGELSYQAMQRSGRAVFNRSKEKEQRAG